MCLESEDNLRTTKNGVACLKMLAGSGSAGFVSTRAQIRERCSVPEPINALKAGL